MTRFAQKRFSVFTSDYRQGRGGRDACPKCGTQGVPLDRIRASWNGEKVVSRPGGREKMSCLKEGCNTTWYITRRDP